MSCELIFTTLTDEQKDQICAILSVGCDRETAGGVVECSVLDIGCAIDDDPQFASKVRRAEATAEFRHMQNVLNATKDGRYWRASAWWLERRSPERFGRRPAGAITPKQLEQILAAWNDRVQQEFNTPDEQRRLTTCYDDLLESIELQLDVQSAETMLQRRKSPPPLANNQSSQAAYSSAAGGSDQSDSGATSETARPNDPVPP